MSFPFYHRRTSDPALAPLFPTYFKKLRNLWDTGTRWYRKQFPMEYWSADLRIDNEHITVALEPRDHFYFEFFTSGNPLVTGTVTQDGNSITSVKAACVGVDVQCDQKTGLTWKAAIREGKRSLDGREISLVARPFQVQLINEPVINPPPTVLLLDRKKEWHFLYESFAPMHSHTGVHLSSYNKGLWTQYGDPGVVPRNTFGNDYAGDSTGTYVGVQLIHYDYTVNTLPLRLNPASAHISRDTFYDVPYMAGTKTAPVQIGYVNDSTVDWPRANGVRTVEHATFGKREFAICVDAFNQISVFPTSKIEKALLNGTDQNVRATYVQTVTPTLPGWVYAPTQRMRDYYTAHTETGLYAFPEYDWKVSPDGKKMCAVVYERVGPVALDTAYFSAESNAASFFSAYVAQTGFASRYGDTLSGTVTFPGATNDRYISGTGLLEVTITIEITGANAEDFTVNTSVAAVRRPTTSAYCTLLAGYARHDIKSDDGLTTYALRNDLIVMDIERYYRLPPGGATVTSVPKSIQGNEDGMFVLKNLTQSTELNSFPLEGGRAVTDPEYGATLQDFDIGTLSFVFIAMKNVSNVIYMATVIYTLNQFREIIFPATANDVTARANMTATAQVPYRNAFTAEWIFYPYNYNPAWEDTADLTALREHLCWEMGFRTRDHPTPWLDDPGTGGSTNPVNQPTYAQRAWFAGLRVMHPIYGLAFVTTPQFTWYSYSDTIMNAISKTPWSTFFVHPGGTWAYFDQSCVYNSGNVPGTSLTAFNTGLLEHHIVDRVHFAQTMPDGTVLSKDLTFKDLYNAAVDALPATQVDFTHLTTANMRAVFSKTYNPNPPFPTGGNFSELILIATWDGTAYQFMDSQYNNSPVNPFTGDPVPPLQGGWQTGVLSLDQWWIPTNTSPLQAQHRTFSSCLLIQ